jgi:hypothetical protein
MRRSGQPLPAAADWWRYAEDLEQDGVFLMADLLLWLYLANSVLLINHEIDSAYWKEWELFKLPGGITGFLLLHFPLLLFIFYGLILVSRHSASGFIFSLILCFGGIFAFVIHTYFLRKGRSEFNKPLSKFILVATLFVSIIQLVVTLYLMI